MKSFSSSLKVTFLVLALVAANGAVVLAQEDEESRRAWYIPELANFGAGVHGGWQVSLPDLQTNNYNFRGGLTFLFG